MNYVTWNFIDIIFRKNLSFNNCSVLQSSNQDRTFLIKSLMFMIDQLGNGMTLIFGHKNNLIYNFIITMNSC